MKKYIVLNGIYYSELNLLPIGDIRRISRSIQVGSEIIEEGEEGISKLIGVINKKTLLIFCLHLFERIRKHIGNISPDIDQFIIDVKKWIYEDIPFVQDESLFSSKDFYGNNSDDYKLEVLNPFVLDIFHTISIESRNVVYCDCHMISNIYLDVSNKKEVDEEYRRQGQFIIDFFKSDDYLFFL